MKLYQPYTSTLMIVLLTAAITLVYPTTAQAQCEVAQLESPDGQGGNAFAGVAVSGDVLVVNDSLAFARLGAAFVYRRGADGPQDLILEATLMAPEPNADEFYAAVTAIHGDLIVVGAPGADTPEFQSGAAYVYRYQPACDSWGYEATLTASDGGLLDHFGLSASIDGDVILIGARDDEIDGLKFAGSAYVYRYDPKLSQWIEEAKLTDPDPAGMEGFGQSVSMKGPVALIGAHSNDDAGGGTGAVFVFRYEHGKPGQWIFEQQLQAFDAQFQAWFGFSVALVGDLAVIGAPQLDSQIGAAYVLRYDGNEWVHEAKLLADNPVGPFPFMGSSVSMSADQGTILVGAPLDDEAGNEAGAAHLFRKDAGEWVEIVKLTASDGSPNAGFGAPVVVHNDVAFIGAPHGSESPGTVYIFVGMAGLDCNENGDPDGCDIFEGSSQDQNGNGIPDECEIPGDLDGDGVVGILDLLMLLAAWGPCDPPCPPACVGDLDANCTVNVIDLLILLSNWG